MVASQGTFNSPTVTGNDSFAHGLGETPKAVIIWGVRDSGDAASYTIAIGYSDGTNHAAVSATSQDAQATSVADRAASDADCIYSAGVTGVVDIKATVASWDATNITLNYSSVNAFVRLHHFLAIGGAGVSAAVFATTSQTSTGEFTAAHGLGVAPTALFALTTGDTGALPDTSTRANIGLGVTDFTDNYSIAAESDDAEVTSKSRRSSLNTAVAMYKAHSADSPVGFFSAVSADTANVTFNQLDADTGLRHVLCLALAGVRAKTVSVTQPGSTGTQAVTDVSFTPKAVLALSANENLGNDTHNRLSFGAAVSASSRGCIWAGDAHGQVTTDASRDSDTGALIKMMTEAGASPTVDAEADLDSFDADGFTLDWVAADATAREMFVLALGDAAATGSRRNRLGLGLGL